MYSNTVSSYATQIEIINDSRNTELVSLTEAEDQGIDKASGPKHERTSSAANHTADLVDLAKGLQRIDGIAGSPAHALVIQTPLAKLMINMDAFAVAKVNRLRAVGVASFLTIPSG